VLEPTVDKRTKANRIWEIFESFDRTPTLREFAQACIDEGVFDDDAPRALLTLAKRECERVITAHDEHGMPRAGVVRRRADGSGEYKLHGLWGPDDYDFVCKERNIQGEADIEVNIRLADECEDRHGYRPKVLRITYEGE
jgi:hypothetical protein